MTRQGSGGQTFDLVAHLHRQRRFSLDAFGPGQRTNGVLDHIGKELAEIREAPADLSEWVDVILLALDGAWRSGHEPEDIAQAIAAKQTRNEGRTWPDWRTADPDKAIEHVSSAESSSPAEIPETPAGTIQEVFAHGGSVKVAAAGPDASHVSVTDYDGAETTCWLNSRDLLALSKIIESRLKAVER
jgi:hypothetical protein